MEGNGRDDELCTLFPTSWSPRWLSTEVPLDPAPPPISAPPHPTSPSSSPTANTLGHDDVINTHISMETFLCKEISKRRPARD